MTSKLSDLQDLIILSRVLLEKAGAQAWDEVADLQSQREEQLNRFFSDPVEPDQADAVSAGIEAIMAINQELMVLASQAKAELGDALHKLDQGKKAVKAYTS
ncbi:MAG: flagellar protein FliT [Gammaproteobacteria bacterium]